MVTMVPCIGAVRPIGELGVPRGERIASSGSDAVDAIRFAHERVDRRTRHRRRRRPLGRRSPVPTRSSSRHRRRPSSTSSSSTSPSATRSCGRCAIVRCCCNGSPTARRAARSSRSACPTTHPTGCTTTIVSTPNGTTTNAFVIADLAHLVWAVNLGCLGFHSWPTRAAEPAALRRAAHRPRPRSGHELRDGAGDGHRVAHVVRRARHPVVHQDHRQSRSARVRAAACRSGTASRFVRQRSPWPASSRVDDPI